MVDAQNVGGESWWLSKRSGVSGRAENGTTDVRWHVILICNLFFSDLPKVGRSLFR